MFDPEINQTKVLTSIIIKKTISKKMKLKLDQYRDDLKGRLGRKVNRGG